MSAFPKNLDDSQKRFLTAVNSGSDAMRQMVALSRNTGLSDEAQKVVDQMVDASLRQYVHAMKQSMQKVKQLEAIEEKRNAKKMQAKEAQAAEKTDEEAEIAGPSSSAPPEKTWSPELEKLLAEMYASTSTHVDVYPPEPLEGEIAIPTGGLAKCQCSPDCTKELPQPAYRVLKAEDNARWFHDEPKKSSEEELVGIVLKPKPRNGHEGCSNQEVVVFV